MPIVRRSNRIQTKKSNQESKQPFKKSQDNVTPVKPNVVKSKTFVKSESPKVCSGCKNTHPPIRRYNIVQWVQCENCDTWWHAECVCVTPEDILKLDLYEIPYTCVLCVLQGSPWIAENHKFKVSAPIIDKKVSKPGSDSGIKQESNPVKPKTLVGIDNCSEGDSEIEKVNGKLDVISSHIIVVDNIKESQNLKSSKVIKDKLSQHPEFQKVDFAYSLPRGGVAIHFNSEKKAEDILENWPESVFSQSEKPHRIRGKVIGQTGFVKNIDIRLADSQLKSFLVSAGCNVQEVRKVFHRHSGKPMPIRKVTFDSVSDLEKAIETEFPFKINGKQAFCEKEKQFKVVRCFSCHRFNHIAANCPYKDTCENCGSEDHIFTGECRKQSVCTNCGGQHKSSSNLCPEYLEIIQKIRKNQMF